MEEVGEILPAVFRRGVRLGGVTLVEILAPLWPRVTGKPIAQHSRPVAFEGGTLTLVTSCPSWAGQLRQMAEEIRAQINRFLGAPVVRKLLVERHESLEPPKPPARQACVPAGLETEPRVAEGVTGLDPEMARMVEQSFRKYFARNARRVN